MVLHDTHFHLDLFPDPRKVVKEIERDGIYTIAVTNLPEVFEHTYAIVKDTKYIRAALGMHPELCSQYYKQIDKFYNLLSMTRYIGEVGLDNMNKAPRDFAVQKRVFEQIIKAVHEAGKKIVTVHSRRAESDLISMIGPHFSGKVIMHWYSGSAAEMRRALDYGFYFSVNYAMAQSETGRRIIQAIPVERLLLETDGPFVNIKGVPSTPATAFQIIKLIAEIKNVQDAETIIGANFATLLQP